MWSRAEGAWVRVGGTPPQSSTLIQPTTLLQSWTPQCARSPAWSYYDQTPAVDNLPNSSTRGVPEVDATIDFWEWLWKTFNNVLTELQKVARQCGQSPTMRSAAELHCPSVPILNWHRFLAAILPGYNKLVVRSVRRFGWDREMRGDSI